MRTRLTGSGTSAYTYTSENRLATGPGGAALAYDSTGRLSQVYTPALSTNFDYDGAALIGERDAVSYGLMRRYVHGPGEDQPLVWYEGAGLTDKRYLMTDERGSVVAVTNNTGAASGINSYDEYGIPASTNVGRFGYTGQTWIPEIGMNYYKARMYSPTLGRFMQTDPIGYKDGVNWYDYVDGDPVNRSDPSGLAGGNGWLPEHFLEAATETAEATGKFAGGVLLRVGGAASMLLTASPASTGPNSKAQNIIDRVTARATNTARAVSSRTIDAATREAKGEVVKLRPDGKPFDHIQKLQEAKNGLTNDIQTLKNQFGKQLGEDQGTRLRNSISDLSNKLDMAKRALDKICKISTQC